MFDSPRPLRVRSTADVARGSSTWLPSMRWGFDYPHPLHVPDLRRGTPAATGRMRVRISPGTPRPRRRWTATGFLNRQEQVRVLPRVQRPRPGGSWHEPPKFAVEVRLLARAPATASVPADPGVGLRSRTAKFNSWQGRHAFAPAAGLEPSKLRVAVRLRAKVPLRSSEEGEPHKLDRGGSTPPAATDPGSSNGRTLAFGADYGGSSPSPGTM